MQTTHFTMGVNDFFDAVLPDFKRHNTIPLSVRGGKNVGVDLSIWLHIAIRSPNAALCLHMHPKYVPDEVVVELKRRHKILVNSGLVPHYVFDGKWHPIKWAAREACNKAHAEAWEPLPHFARLDFEQFPIACVASNVLDCWAATRGVIFKKDDTHQQKNIMLRACLPVAHLCLSRNSVTRTCNGLALRRWRWKRKPAPGAPIILINSNPSH